MEPKARIFIGSSTEGIPVAEYIKEQLKNDFDCYLWTDDLFKFNASALDTLLKLASLFDFGMLIATKDDFTHSRAKSFETPRDNVIFEFGLFIGRLGATRSFVIQEADAKLPSDMLGITVPRFDISGGIAASPSLKKEIERIKNTIYERMALGELGLLPSTALAIGYFNNFVSIVCQAVCSLPELKVEQHTFKKFELNIVMPGDLDADIKKRATVFSQKNSLKQIQLEAPGRSYPVFVTYNETGDELLRMYDMPTTLLGIDKAIEIYMKKGHIGKTVEQKLLEQRELQNFRRTLQILINNDAFCKGMVKIVEE